MSRKVGIGLLGFGNVGTGAYKIFDMNKEVYINRCNAEPEVRHILVNDVNKDRGVSVAEGVLTCTASDVYAAEDVDIVIEVLGGIEPATTYMLEAMKAGKHVVTANKAAVAANYEKLTAAAKENGVEFRFEASVGGAIPVLTSIQTQLLANDFTEVMGIVNGTTNYILTKMSVEGLAYGDVLKKAQELGFAEADPTADVEGIDVANKLSILIALLFNEYVAPDSIPRVGITGITMDDIEEAKRNDEVIKLIARAAKKADGTLEYSVKPTRLNITHPLAGVSNEFNAVFVNGNACDSLMFYGRGAGPLPTGSAVCGDVAMIIQKCLQ